MYCGRLSAGMLSVYICCVHTHEYTLVRKHEYTLVHKHEYTLILDIPYGSLGGKGCYGLVNFVLLLFPNLFKKERFPSQTPKNLHPSFRPYRYCIVHRPASVSSSLLTYYMPLFIHSWSLWALSNTDCVLQLFLSDRIRKHGLQFV
jgi:hypothetical protein